MIHGQSPVPNWLEAIDRLPDLAVVKWVTVQQLAEVYARNPNIITMLRYVNDGLQQVSSSDTDATRANRARTWFNSFIDGTFLNGSTAGVPHWKATKVIGWWNEYYANSQSAAEKELWWRQERVAAQVWRDEYRNNPAFGGKLSHIRLAICAAAVGNDIPWQSAQTAKDFDCVLDYHTYTYYYRGIRAANDWDDLSGRWEGMDEQFRSMGFSVPWLFGESGPFESAVTGWRHEECLGGNVQAYVNAVEDWIIDTKETLAYQQGRVLGFCLFTTGGGAQWAEFETKQPELNTLADMVDFTWVPTPPQQDFEEALTEHSIERQIACGVSLNKIAAIQRTLIEDGFQPVTKEEPFTFDGETIRWQAAETLDGSLPRRVYWAEIPASGQPWVVNWFEAAP